MNDLGKESKNFRTLDMYVRLCEGKLINKTEESRKFGVDERSIQRDIDDIRLFLAEQSVKLGDGREIIYDRTKKGFIMVGDEPSMMTNSEILAVSKILLESRAFTKRELKTILDKLVEGCVPIKNIFRTSYGRLAQIFSKRSKTRRSDTVPILRYDIRSLFI